jgi:uncharacterized protein YjbI with pentapeptide repeats
MANPEHVEMIGKGAAVWNEWRRANPFVIPDLSGFQFIWKTSTLCPDLSGVNLADAYLKGAFLQGSDKDWPDEWGPHFGRADFSGANMQGITIIHDWFHSSNLRGADLSGASLIDVSFEKADLTAASFAGSELSNVSFVEAIVENIDLQGAKLKDVRLPDILRWNPKRDAATQMTGIAVTAEHEATVAVDDLDLAKLVSLLLDSENLRKLINLLTQRVVLILGRFDRERKEILDLIREQLRSRGYLAIVFDFQKPARRDLTETIQMLAQMSRFVLADITEAKSIPQELQAVVPNLPSVAFVPILKADHREYAMFEHFRRYPWVLPIFLYRDEKHLTESLDRDIIDPAVAKSDELTAPGPV